MSFPDAVRCDVLHAGEEEEASMHDTSFVPGSALSGIAVRVFDLYAAVVVVSCEPGRYIRNATDSSKLRFLAIDSVSRNKIGTTFDAEFRRLAAAMTTYRRLPPFPDPVSPPLDESGEVTG
jgi:hypothetical protein